MNNYIHKSGNYFSRKVSKTCEWWNVVAPNFLNCSITITFLRIRYLLSIRNPLTQLRNENFKIYISNIILPSERTATIPEDTQKCKTLHFVWSKLLSSICEKYFQLQLFGCCLFNCKLKLLADLRCFL